MAISQILLKNLTQGPLAISAISGSKGQALQLVLATGASVDVGTSTNLETINRLSEIQSLVTKGALSVTYSPGTSDIQGSPGIPDTFGRETAVHQHVTVPAGTGGSPSDTIIYNANSPKLRILDAAIIVTTAVGGSTATLRTATAGGGTAVSDAFNTATTGYKRMVSLTSSSALAAGSSLVLRLSDGGVACELLLTVDVS